MADRYYTVLDFMVSELQLKGLERDIYAIIYGFCQAGRTYTGSLQYLADWTLTTKQGVIKVLKKLEEKGLLIKEEKIINNVKFNEYKTVRPEVNSSQLKVNSSQLSLPVCNIGDIDSQHSLTGVVNRVERGSQQSLPNNKDINKDDNKEDNLLTGFDLNKEEKERLSGALSDFSEMRKKITKPLTNRALQIIINKLSTLSNGNVDIAIEILENSIANSWQGVFPLKQEDKKARKEAPANDIIDYPF